MRKPTSLCVFHCNLPVSSIWSLIQYLNVADVILHHRPRHEPGFPSTSQQTFQLINIKLASGQLFLLNDSEVFWDSMSIYKEM